MPQTAYRPFRLAGPLALLSHCAPVGPLLGAVMLKNELLRVEVAVIFRALISRLGTLLKMSRICGPVMSPTSLFAVDED